jgi:hypothetical protein
MYPKNAYRLCILFIVQEFCANDVYLMFFICFNNVMKCYVLIVKVNSKGFYKGCLANYDVV